MIQPTIIYVYVAREQLLGINTIITEASKVGLGVLGVAFRNPVKKLPEVVSPK